MRLTHWLQAVCFETASRFSKAASQTRQAPVFRAEELERRLFLSSAIAAFQPQQTLAVGSEPVSVAIGDLNGDGKLDLAVANYNSNSVGVLLGNGNGTFQPQHTFTTGAEPRSISIADVNGDGKPDLLYVNGQYGTLGVMLGNGNGTFLAQHTFAAGGWSESRLAVGDLNGDGNLDAVVTSGGASVSVLLGNGNGTFRSATSVATFTVEYSLALADTNADGKPDLVVGNGEPAVGVLLGNGNGTFQSEHDFSLAGVSGVPESITVADFNGDGKLDVATANEENTISVLLGNGNGTFQAQQTYAVGSTPFGIAAADVNVDGKPDLIIANQGGFVGVLLGNGNGTFQAQTTFAAQLNATAIAVADLNRDGRPDVVCPDFGSGVVSVLLGDVPPVVTSIVRTTPPGPTTTGNMNYTVTFNEPVFGLTASDFTVTTNVGGGLTWGVGLGGSGAVYNVSVSVPPGSGTATVNLVDHGDVHDALGNPLQPGGAAFQTAQTFTAGSYARTIVVSDINGDGKPDLVVPYYYRGGSPTYINRSAAVILLGNGNGTFQNVGGATISFQSFLNNRIDALAVADVNGDGKPDLVAALNYGAVAVLLGNGNASFQAPKTFATGSDPSAIAATDLNGDGKPDLLVANQGSNTVSVLLGNGNGTFQAQQTFATGTTPIAIGTSDFNRDGRPDVVVANNGSNSLSVLLGNGNGTFQPQRTLAAGTHPISMAVADLNGDGSTDLAVANYGSGTVSGNVGVLLGNGNGTFQPQQTFAAGPAPVYVSTADINGDGKPDLIVNNLDYAAVRILLGNGDGTFQPQQTFNTGGASFATVTSDFNGDGRPDLAVVNYGQTGAYATSTVSVLLGNSNGNFTGQTYTVIPPTIVTSINRSSPATFVTGASTVSYAVNFSGTVSNVLPSEFQVITTGSVATALPVVVTGGGSSYTVTITHVHGSGTLQLALVDHDAIVDSYGTPLGGIGYSNGSFTGPSYWIEQTAPTVVSINRSSPAGQSTTASSVTYAVTFSTNVTGVVPSDFQVATTGNVSYANPLVIGGSGSTYTVTINGILGTGQLTLDLVDDGAIRDLAGNPLRSSTPFIFGSAQTFATNGGAANVEAGDLNGDGIPDLMVPNFSYGTVSILLGNGNGTFARPQRYTAANPYFAQIADVNGDGYPDLIVSNSNNAVDILLGNGNGTFQAQRTLASGGTVGFGTVAVADLNGDGKPDIVVLNEVSKSVGILLGNGNGTFLPAQTFAAGSTTSDLESLAIADLNGDGKPDLIVANYNSNNVTVFLGNGNGTFEAGQTFATGKGPRVSAQAIDLNGDGNPDLVVANAYNNTVGVLLGNGNGTFQPQQTLATQVQPRSPWLTDVNADGNPDLLVGGVYLNQLLGNGNGTFQPFSLVSVPTEVTSVIVSDVNLDGRPDVITTSDSSFLSVNTNIDTDNVTGQTYSITPPTVDTVSGTSNVDQITLYQSQDQTHVVWVLNGSTNGQLPITDPNGLTINGNGSDDVITMNFTYGNNPLPNLLHLNGTFTVNNLTGANPFAGTNVEIGRSTVYITYAGPSSDPIAVIKTYLQAGYNNGAWNGTPTASTGVITSIPAANNASQTTAIGYADSADGLISGQPVNTIEFKYTLYGDTTLTGTVGFNDFTRLTQHYNQTAGGTWDTGDFNYDGNVNFADFTLMTRTYNTSVGSQASPAIAAVGAAASAPSIAPPQPTAVQQTSTANESAVSPVVQMKPTLIVHHASIPKAHKKNRRRG